MESAARDRLPQGRLQTHAAAVRTSGFWRNNGLSIAVLTLFIVMLAAQVLAGFHEHNEERQAHGEPPLALPAYLVSDHFIEATAENWESEFLQMAAYVLLTVLLFQRGSSESKKLDEPEAVDRDPRAAKKQPGTPWPVLRGGWILRIYENSLSLAFVVLFLISFWLHAVGGAGQYSADRVAHGELPVGVLEYLRTARFWFESMQNWQSEFLSLAAMVWLSIYLRQRGSPESKPVDAPHRQTGQE
jgi:hypothetical protein